MIKLWCKYIPELQRESWNLGLDKEFLVRAGTKQWRQIEKNMCSGNYSPLHVLNFSFISMPKIYAALAVWSAIILLVGNTYARWQSLWCSQELPTLWLALQRSTLSTVFIEQCEVKPFFHSIVMGLQYTRAHIRKCYLWQSWINTL